MKIKTKSKKCIFENEMILEHRKLNDLARKIKKSKDFLQIFGMWKHFLDIL